MYNLHKSQVSQLSQRYCYRMMTRSGTRLGRLLGCLAIFGEERDSREIIRCHPDYRSSGPWHDVVEVNYSPHGLFPARCLAIFSWPANADRDFSPGEVVVLTHEARESNPELGSMLFDHWTLKQKARGSSIVASLDCVSASSITRRLFGVVVESGQELCFEMRSSGQGKPRPKFSLLVGRDRQLDWPAQFLASHKAWDKV